VASYEQTRTHVPAFALLAGRYTVISSSTSSASIFPSSMCSFPNAYRQLKPPRSCAARVEVQHALFHFNFRLMTVAVDDCVDSCGFGLQIEPSQIMQHVDRDAADFDDFSLRKGSCPRFGVDVAANRSNRSNLRERVEYFRIADVPRMQDAIGSAQSFDSLTPQQAVCVRDDAEDHGN
jgi:hypothetical protein